MKYPVVYLDGMTEKAESFVYSTWLKSYRNTDWGRNMCNDTYFHHHKEIIDVILASPLTRVTIIADKDDQDTFYGYIVCQVVSGKPIVHYCYMKYNFRKLHLMSGLISHLGYFDSNNVHFVTHLPRHYPKLKTKYNLEFNPYLLGDNK